MDTELILHRAPWIAPIVRPVSADGGVLVAGGRIVAAGPFRELCRRFDGCRIVEHPESVLLPGLVNAHIHLELSHLGHLARSGPPPGFTAWIESLLEARTMDLRGDEELLAIAGATLDRLYRDGVIVLADIGNTVIGRSLQAGFPGVLLHFTEYLGHGRSGLPGHLDRLAREADDSLCTAHAPYSVHAVLLRALKERARRLGHPFSIHVAETGAEILMMRQGRGELVDFLRHRGFWDGSFRSTGIDNTGSVQYLHQLGVLDAQTLCVHMVHVSDAEIGLLTASRAGICLCPGSNRFLGVGRPPVAAYLRHGILPALGTDSLASNPELSLWREMRLLSEEHPDVRPEEILAMATLGGARGLLVEDEFGSLEPGRRADVLAVPVPAGLKDGREVAEFLVTAGQSVDPCWIRERE